MATKKSSMEKASKFRDVSEIKSFDFSKGTLKNEVKKMHSESRRIIENSKVDSTNLRIRFEV